jgi:hypothetical protein
MNSPQSLLWGVNVLKHGNYIPLQSMIFSKYGGNRVNINYTEIKSAAF